MCLRFVPGSVILALASLASAGPLSERRLPEQRGQIAGLAFSPDGKFLATVTDGHSMNGELRAWNVATGEERAVKFDHPANLGFSAVALSPDGQWLATAYWKQVKLQPVGFVALLHVPSGNLMNEWRAHDSGAYAIAFSTDSNTIASGGADGYVRLWEVKTNKERRALKAPGGRVYAVTFSRDGKHLAAINGDGTVNVWDAAGKSLEFSANRHEQMLRSTTGTPICRALAFSPDGGRLTSGDSAGNILVWDVATGRPGKRIRLPNAEPIRGLAFRPTDHMLAVAAGPTIRLVDPDTGNESSRIGGYSECVYSLAISTDGLLLAAGDRAQARIRSTQFAAESPSAARNIDRPPAEAKSNESPSTNGMPSLDMQADRGPWLVAIGAGIMIVVLGTIVLVCRRG